jgi:hypothetical protein
MWQRAKREIVYRFLRGTIGFLPSRFAVCAGPGVGWIGRRNPIAWLSDGVPLSALSFATHWPQGEESRLTSWSDVLIATDRLKRATRNVRIVALNN